jgi:RHS repeat-associated protein
LENQTDTSLQKDIPIDPLAPTIKAEMTVSESGALSYMLPIEIHKGINDFQPNISLSYNSQSGNGMAGWGWNITGLSMISRGGKSQDIDGVTVGTQFNDSDPFYLDGQRLIKISETNFVTEKYSKIKITKHSNGDFQFIVKYTDGKIAKYKELTPGQYYISSFQDAFDNTINYYYHVENYVARVYKISYGGTTEPFSIDFEYKLRKTPTEAYRNGLKFLNQYILSNITSNSSYDQLFRKYILTHDFINGNKNERIRRVDVENKQGAKLKPLQFDYNLGVLSGSVEKQINSVSGFPSNTKELGDIVAGDFFGDGKLSTCYITKAIDGTFSLVNSKSGNLSITIGSNAKLIAGKTLTTNNKLSERDQLIIAHTGLFAKLQIIDLLTMESRMMDTSFQATGTWHWDIVTGQLTFDMSKSSDNFISGDFNNDGLLDLIHFIPPTAYSAGEAHLTEVGKTLGTATISESLQWPNPYFIFDQVYQIEMDGDGISELMFLDQGKYSIYKIDYLQKKLIPLDNLQAIQLADYTNDIYRKRTTPLIFGDFNGDGLTDFMTPKKIYYIDADNSAGEVAKKMEQESQFWWQYINTGKAFIAKSKDYTAQKLAYMVPSQRVYARPGGSFWSQLWSEPPMVYDYTEYGATSVMATDFNNDGKTDLISFSKFGKVKYSDTQKLSLAETQNMDVIYIDFSTGLPKPKATLYTNKIFFHENISSDIIGSQDYSTLPTVMPMNQDIVSPFSVPLLYTSFNYLNTYKSALAIIDPLTHKEISFTINNDRFTEQLIKKVSNGSSVDQQMDYLPMMTAVNSKQERCYTAKDYSYTFKYPYYIHKNNGSTYLVSKIHTLFNAKILSKEYRYENAVQNLSGKGFLGFEKSFASDVYESELKNGKYINKNPLKAVFWTITTRDALADNAIIQKTYGGLNKFITDSFITNTKFDKGNHQYLILATNERNKDNLRKITIYKTYEYDETDDLKLKTSFTDYNGVGSSITKFTYKPEFLNGDHYFYGKVSSTENITYKDGLSFSSKNETNYLPNGNVSETQEYGNDINLASIKTSYTYDSYGNKKTETLSTIGIASQTTSFDYDPTNRFINKITSLEGLETSFTINTLGLTTSETSQLGLTTSYLYDPWGNKIVSTDFLGKKTTLSKTIADPSIGGVYNLQTQREGGVATIVTYDNFDRIIQTQTNAVNGKWVVAKNVYDIFGRKIKESEPSFEGEPFKWNIIEYDEMNRPVKNISFTGKTITTCYEGLKVTVDDGYKKTSKTLDAMGHTIRQEDHGGIISFSYFPNGVIKETNYSGIKTTYQIDGWGNKTKLIDPSAGTFIYEYDNLKRLVKQQQPKGYTLYSYDDYGKLITEKTYGNTAAENTNIEINYTYDNQSKLPEVIAGTSNGKIFNYTTYYDQYYRIVGKKEETPEFQYIRTSVYDGYGREEITNISTVVSGYTSNSSIKNIFDSNGILIQKNDNILGNMIWHISDVNSRGQVTQMEYGNGYTISNQYNPADFQLFNMRHQNTNNGTIALDIDYNFDVNKGILNSRKNNLFNKKEDFTFDKLNRLLTEAVNNVLINQYTYDQRGRITSNTELGVYKYNETNYKLKGIDLNTNGQLVKSERGFANITYNVYQNPIKIIIAGKDNLAFEYNIFKTRYSMMSRASNSTKYYSSDFAIEIKKSLQSSSGTLVNATQIITYLTGDPYSAEYIKKEVITGGVITENSNYYLHRDNISSIVAITKTDGSIVEKRFFDAWGNLRALINSTGQTITGTQQLAATDLFLDRGYTGHEHLWKVGLINMNARLYDPIVRRFASPDNLVPDMYNTQSYDRFGYAYNNPLLYVDFNGNEAITLGAVAVATAIAIAVGITTKVIMNAINGVPIWYGLGKAAVVSGVMGAISFGIGTAATNAAVGFIGKAALQAGMHAISGGVFSALEDGNFYSGFLSGAISSIASSAITALGTNFKGSGAAQDANRNYISKNSFGSGDLIKAVMLVSGGLSGGLSATIAGGNFWKGFRQGILTAGLNHLAHDAATMFEDETTMLKRFLTAEERQRIGDKYPEYDKYPTPESVYKEVGGALYDLYLKNPNAYLNTCAIRLSVAFEKAGINIGGQYYGLKGLKYYTSATQMAKALEDRFYSTTKGYDLSNYGILVQYNDKSYSGTAYHVDVVYILNGKGEAGNQIFGGHYNKYY